MKERVTIYITQRQRELLKELNERTHVPQAVYIRRGVDAILKQHTHHLSQDIPRHDVEDDR